MLVSGRTGKVTSLSFSLLSDGRLLLTSGSSQGAARVWDVEGCHDVVAVLREYHNLVVFLKSPDGRLLVALGDNIGTNVGNVEPLALPLSIRRQGYSHLDAPPVVQSIAFSMPGSEEPWSLDPGKPYLANGKYVATLRLTESHGNAGVAISPDGTRLAVCHSKANKVVVYSLPEGSLQQEFGSQGCGSKQFSNPQKICFLPANGHILIADCWNKRIQVRDF